MKQPCHLSQSPLNDAPPKITSGDMTSHALASYTTLASLPPRFPGPRRRLNRMPRLLGRRGCCPEDLRRLQLLRDAALGPVMEGVSAERARERERECV